jgi:hypothetical protein
MAKRASAERQRGLLPVVPSSSARGAGEFFSFA